MGNVLVVGSLNMDVTTYVTRMPAQGETVTGKGFLLSPGGKGSNQAVAASRMGAHVKMIGAVGRDSFGDTLLGALSDAKVDVSGVLRSDMMSTGMASIIVQQGDNRIILYGGANQAVSRTQIEMSASMFDWCDSVVVQLEIPLDSVLCAAKMAKKHGKPLFFNPAPAQPLPEEAYRLASYFVPNETEAGLLLGQTLVSDADMLGALDQFRALGVENPVITLGGRGAACFLDGAATILDAHRVNAVDTTAAGDTFIGALAASLSNGRAFRDAAELAMRAAAICVTRQGAQKTIPGIEEVLAWRPDEQPAAMMRA